MKHKRAILLAVAGALLIAALVYLARGDRYRLYTNAHARHCWEAVQQLAVASDSLTPVTITSDSDAGRVSVNIGYQADRVLAGAVLTATCTYAPSDRRADSIELNGRPVDAETLARINTALER